MTRDRILQALAIKSAPPFDPADFLPATQAEKEQIDQMNEATTYWKDAWRRLKKNKIAIGALVAIILLLLFAVIGPFLSPYHYSEQIRGSESLAPSLAHPFGTDNLGRDLLVRTMIGCRISLAVGLVSALIVLLIGSAYGAISGLAGGMTDNIMMRIVDIMNALPTILLVVAVKMVIEPPIETLINTNPAFRWLQKVGPGFIAIFIVYGLLYWGGMARIVRGQVLQLKEMEYINAAVALGADKGRLIRKHLLPNCVGQLVVTTMLQIPSAIFTEAFLSFLGIGVSVPMASLGSLCSDGLNGIISYPYRELFPAVAISIIILAFNLFGDGLRDALDPRLKK